MSSKYLYLLIIIPLFFFLQCSGESEPKSASSAAKSIVTAEASLTDLSDTRIVSAPVVAYRRVYITARTAGQVLEVNFEEGDRVRQGQVLARLDTRRQEAQLRNARASLAEAHQHYQRYKQLFEQQVITPAEYETALLGFKQAESEVDFWTVETDLGVIKSPLDAVVSARLIEAGTTVNTNDRLFTIEDHNLLVVRPALSELDVARLEKGQKLELTFDVVGEEAFPGTIRRIFPSADPLSRLFTLEVEIHQDQIPHTIRPGYLARTRFAIDDRSNVLAIPSEAILERNGKSVAFVVDSNKVVEREIEPGIERDGKIEIRKGLQEGEKVAAGNISVLKDGDEVKVVGTFRRHGFR